MVSITRIPAMTAQRRILNGFFMNWERSFNGAFGVRMYPVCAMNPTTVRSPATVRSLASLFIAPPESTKNTIGQLPKIKSAPPMILSVSCSSLFDSGEFSFIFDVLSSVTQAAHRFNDEPRVFCVGSIVFGQLLADLDRFRSRWCAA